jgi:hypothetical protein
VLLNRAQTAAEDIQPREVRIDLGRADGREPWKSAWPMPTKLAIARALLEMHYNKAMMFQRSGGQRNPKRSI